MQTLFVFIFAAGLVLFGMSRFDVSPDEITTKVNESVTENIEPHNEDERVQDVEETVIESDNQQTEPVISSHHAEAYSSMEVPVEPSVDMVLTEQHHTSSSETQIVSAQQPEPVESVEKEYHDVHTREELLQVNLESDTLLKHFNSIRNSY